MLGTNQMALAFKLGTHRAGVGIVEYRYPDVWELNGEKIVAAPSSQHVAMLERLSTALPDPVTIRYRLLEPAEGYAEGDYVLEVSLSRSELVDLLREFRGLFEQDARHCLILESSSGARLQYDEHNVVICEGPLDAYRQILAEAGLREGSVVMPFPHSHHVHPELDSELGRLLTTGRWHRDP